jgi:protein-S-isoprenylcysteine O-methyltransferase Ste14
MAGKTSLVVRNVVFTFVVPGTGAILIPWRILRSHPATPTEWTALPTIVLGVALYLWCVWVFASVGRGTPGPWDAPRHLVAVGPYRWVRNPIYIAALAVILGEAWLFLSEPLLVYAGEAAIVCHLFVIGYEERTLRHRFGEDYVAYARTVNRWVPRRPRAETAREVPASSCNPRSRC